MPATRKRNKRYEGVVSKTIKIMSDPKKWCQGFWATDDNEYELDADPTGCKIPGIENAGVHFIESNSPKARKFCVEGAIYRAAGREFKTAVAGERAADIVIERLNEIVSRHGEDFTQAQSLNDSNGDASRVKLVDFLKVLRAELRGE